MAEQTNIEWCDSTFSPWIGCTKVSPACDSCYAAVSMPSRVHGIVWGPGQPRHRTSPQTWNGPRRWNRNAAAFHAVHGRRQRVFCASLSDVFDNEVPPLWRADLFALIRETPALDWLLLTKRIGNVRGMVADALEAIAEPRESWPLSNVWLGISVVTQTEVDRDVPKLLAVPAAKRFLSIEPMLGQIDLSGCLPIENVSLAGWRRRTKFGEPDSGLDWVIVGGESGPNARPMHPDWPRAIRDQCAAAGTSYFFKQHGEWVPWEPGLGTRVVHVSASDGMTGESPGLLDRGAARADTRPMVWVGKKAAGSMLDGRTYKDTP